jgi:antitoxin component YwqK of YwqJK toxin-antitoxin module
MIKSLLIPFSFIFIISACNQNKVEIQKEYYDNGTLKAEAEHVDGKLDGVSKEYYINGKLKTEAYFKNDKQDGMTKTYFENGNVEREIYFKNGIQIDTAKFYYLNGELKEISILNNGVKEGDYIEYHENGKIKLKGTLSNNKPAGHWTRYNQYGNLIDSTSFEALQAKISLQFKTYNNQNDGFSILYPATWDFKENYNEASFIAVAPKSNNFSVSINVLVINMPNNQSLEEVFNSNIQDLQNSYYSFKLIDKKKVSSKYRMVYSIDMNNNLTLITTSEYVERQNKCFIITCLSRKESYPEYKSLFEKLITSIQFLDTNV